MKRFNDFYTAYNFLQEHKMVHPPYPGCPELTYNKGFMEALHIDVVKVNTKIQVSLEFGAIVEADKELGLDQPLIAEHDHRLDCGADTFEEAIIKLANLVDTYYNDNGTEK